MTMDPGLQDPQSPQGPLSSDLRTPLGPPPGPLTAARSIFWNETELRAGWRLLIYLLLVIVFVVLGGFLSMALHLPQIARSGLTATGMLVQDGLGIAAALVAVYIVLGVLYESLIHPITILSTLPSAGLGALLALMLTGTDLTIIALIGIILLIGIVKKNAILMIDFAIESERGGRSPEEAIRQASILRLRPILMTTMAALLGGLPLALGFGIGSELRRPLGIAIVGGLIVSQMLTLYTTPVIYLYLDRLTRSRVRQSIVPAGATS